MPRHIVRELAELTEWLEPRDVREMRLGTSIGQAEEEIQRGAIRDAASLE
jgi:hypothetical protein